MNIGAAAKQAELPTKTIRYYEEIGLIRPAARGANGYRDYSNEDLHILRFVQRARGLGFGVRDCRELLSLYRDRNRASADVKALAEQRIAAVERKIEELQSLRETLCHLVERCTGDDRPECPILSDLAAESQ